MAQGLSRSVDFNNNLLASPTKSPDRNNDLTRSYPRLITRPLNERLPAQSGRQTETLVIRRSLENFGTVPGTGAPGLASQKTGSSFSKTKTKTSGFSETGIGWRKTLRSLYKDLEVVHSDSYMRPAVPASAPSGEDEDLTWVKLAGVTFMCFRKGKMSTAGFNVSTLGGVGIEHSRPASSGKSRKLSQSRIQSSRGRQPSVSGPHINLS